jgi:hypothetical protein
MMDGMELYWTVQGSNAWSYQNAIELVSVINKYMSWGGKRRFNPLLFHTSESQLEPPTTTFHVISTSHTVMPPSTRAKNANQHPGQILLADIRKRYTKVEITANSEKKKFHKAITDAALHQLHQFIATEEDRLAESEIDAHGKKKAPPVHP